MRQKGFTLIELVLVVALMAIAAGVSSDIVVTLVKSYNKTQVVNEIEQSANFVLLKLEKELRNAVNATASENSISFTDKSGSGIKYAVAGGGITRQLNSDAALPLVDTTFEGGGVNVSCNGTCFTNVDSDLVDVIKISLTFQQASSTGKKAFEGNINVDTTVVVRGSY